MLWLDSFEGCGRKESDHCSVFTTNEIRSLVNIWSLFTYDTVTYLRMNFKCMNVSKIYIALMLRKVDYSVIPVLNEGKAVSDDLRE